MACGNKIQTWSDESDVVLCREILVLRPYQYQKGSKESGNAWNLITDIMNEKVEELSVTTKSVRDHFNLLLTKQKNKKRENERASGINIKEKEIDTFLDEILEDIENCQEVLSTQSDAKRQAEAADKEKAEEIRMQAMETYGESRKRKNEDDDRTPKRGKRRSGSETIQFLADRNEANRQQHAEEMKLRREELELKKQEAENSREQFNFVMQMQMQIQQQQMQQQFQMQQQQMQQQTRLFAVLLEKINK